jgi:hypothetical protein
MTFGGSRASRSFRGFAEEKSREKNFHRKPQAA